MKLLTAILISVPTSALFILWFVLSVLEGFTKDGIIVFVVLLAIVTIVLGRTWNKYFETKQHGKQSKMDDYSNSSK